MGILKFWNSLKRRPYPIEGIIEFRNDLEVGLAQTGVLEFWIGPIGPLAVRSFKKKRNGKRGQVLTSTRKSIRTARGDNNHNRPRVINRSPINLTKQLRN